MLAIYRRSFPKQSLATGAVAALDKVYSTGTLPRLLGLARFQ